MAEQAQNSRRSTLIEYPELYKIGILVSVALLATILVFSYLYWETTFEFLSGKWDVGAVFLVTALLYVLISLEIIRTNERAGITMFGRPVVQLEPGLYYVPWIFLQLIRFPRTVIQAQFPGEPEHVIKGDDAAFSQMYAGLSIEDRKNFVRPIRITTARPRNKLSLKDAPLNTQMTIEISFVVRFFIVNVFNFAANIESITSAIRQIRDTGEALLSAAVSKRTVGEVVEELAKIKEELEKAINDATESWGIKLESASVLSPDINHEVAKALRDATTARAAKLKTITDAEAAREKIRLEGEGQAGRIEAIKKATGADGLQILAAETAKEAFGKGNVIVAGVQGGISDVMSSVLGASAALAKHAGNQGKGTT